MLDHKKKKIGTRMERRDVARIVDRPSTVTVLGERGVAAPCFEERGVEDPDGAYRLRKTPATRPDVIVREEVVCVDVPLEGTRIIVYIPEMFLGIDDDSPILMGMAPYALPLFLKLLDKVASRLEKYTLRIKLNTLLPTMEPTSLTPSEYY